MPTSEFVPGHESGGWWGIGAPRETPDVIVDKLNREINLLLADSKTEAQMQMRGPAPNGR